jgi:hypothetical protein
MKKAGHPYHPALPALRHIVISKQNCTRYADYSGYSFNNSIIQVNTI